MRSPEPVDPDIAHPHGESYVRGAWDQIERFLDRLDDDCRVLLAAAAGRRAQANALDPAAVAADLEAWCRPGGLVGKAPDRIPSAAPVL
ncbi:hypothetical protein ACWEK5_45800 [Rhodococcus koreensis]